MKKTIGNSAQLEQWLEAEAKIFLLDVPPGWISSRDYAKMRNLGLYVARRRLNKMVEQGLATSQWHTLPTSGGRQLIYQLLK